MTERLAALRTQLAAHRPADAAEHTSLGRTLRLLDWLDDPFDQDADPTHLTGSAVVVDRTGRVLLHRHKRLGIWLQPGGHLDADEQPWEAAVRETHEETGTDPHHVDDAPRLLHVDVHEGPRGHVHLDLRYLLTADADAPLRPAAGESPEVDWFTPSRALAVADTSLAAAIHAARRVR
ncbi:MAG: NUDIX domain-containing protein [Nitriliruptoraceae bacterium]|nr:NUDIX domain-containing protein [Nitriliruptoraceae bacterium]